VSLTVVEFEIESSSRLAIDRDIKLNTAMYVSPRVCLRERHRLLTKTFGFPLERLKKKENSVP